MKHASTLILSIVFSFGAYAQKGYAVIETFSLGDTVTISINNSYFRFNNHYYQLILHRTNKVSNLETVTQYVITDRDGNPVESGIGKVDKKKDSFYRKMVSEGKQVGKWKYKRLRKSWPNVDHPFRSSYGGVGPK